MKHRALTREVEEKHRTTAIECDLCGAYCPNPESGNWGKSRDDDSFYTNVYCYGSAAWDHCGCESYDEKKYGVCKACWESVLVPVLEKKATAVFPESVEEKR